MTRMEEPRRQTSHIDQQILQQIRKNPGVPTTKLAQGASVTRQCNSSHQMVKWCQTNVHLKALVKDDGGQKP